ncbi:EamA-like transporter family protein [Maribacter vaceletii]|uniref:EamA-like transporter family protein n=1 Tax=Maribacter vaceletii TaxID=1206816 RepID=A0A495E904_9FLAO|nr:DMT family transporter [Maribacter vaceletii]RKR13402.1 EamA-like transporter family protein [Maribacter vaceletii]
MLNLCLSILFSSLIFVIFKLFSIYKVQTLYAIITNYVVACSVGLFLYKESVTISSVIEKPWFLGTLILGGLFIVVFNLMAATAQKVGVSVASVATKMSFVIPAIIGVIAYKEHLGVFKVIGIFLAMGAVYFASIKESNTKINFSVLLLPALVFFGSGIIDTTINFFQKEHVTPSEFPLFSAMIFGSAAVIGVFFILIQSPKKPLKINFKNSIGGVVLGIPNYFSVFFLLKALNNPEFNSASIFTLNNVAVVMFSTLLGILLFKEKISTKNWGGIALAVISILLVALA